jgi:hypothetical protein
MESATFYFPLWECETVTPSFSQDSAVLSCRGSAPPVGTSCAWNAELSSRLGVPLYSCSSVLNGTSLPAMVHEHKACLLTASDQTARFQCPRA